MRRPTQAEYAARQEFEERRKAFEKWWEELDEQFEKGLLRGKWGENGKAERADTQAVQRTDHAPLLNVLLCVLSATTRTRPVTDTDFVIPIRNASIH